MTWKATSEQLPDRGQVVVAIDRHNNICFAMLLDRKPVEEWWECEIDGCMVFDRNGSPASIEPPVWWTLVPTESGNDISY